MSMRARLEPSTSENIRIAAALLKQGEVVGMPTETVYGLAGDALSEKALTRIFSAKERPTFDPLIVHVGPRADHLDGLIDLGLINAGRLSASARDLADRLIARFWPGPLTLVLPKSPRVPDLATSGLPNVALRMPAHPVAQALIEAAGTPLAAPSANRFGRISPTSAADVMAELGDRIPLVLDGGRCMIGVESTVLLIGDDGTLTLLRPGGVSRDEIETLAQTTVNSLTRAPASSRGLLAPGLLDSHYAPRKQMFLHTAPLDELNIEQLNDLKAALGELKCIGLLTNRDDEAQTAHELSETLEIDVVTQALSRAGDPAEAARRLFAALRQLDETPTVEALLVEQWPEATGLGHAIADRLARAASRHFSGKVN